MNKLREAMEHYLSLRRSLGFKLINVESTLKKFITFVEKEGFSYITVDLITRWANLSTAKEPSTLAGRFNVVRNFAIWRSASDGRTQIPPKNYFPYHYRRKPPHIYSDNEIEQLVLAARQLSSPKGLRGPTYATFFGLLSVTGMRISEAIAIDKNDVDLNEGVLNIRESKFRKSRIVPIHQSTCDALSSYAKKRDLIFPSHQCIAFFVSERGARVSQWAVRDNFAIISRHIGIRRKIPGKRIGHGPRIHDMRHRFAVRTLVDWYRADVNVDREIHKLATYMWHAHINDTYWYLEAVPELLELATQKMIKRK